MAELDHNESDHVLFVAEAMLLYFDEAQVKDLILALESRFPGAELVCDVCTPFAVRIDNLQLLFMRSAARIRWAVRDPEDVETWSPGIRLVESFSYFDGPEPRMGLPSWLVRFAFLSRATSIQRYQLGTAPSTSIRDDDRSRDVWLGEDIG